MDNNIYIGLDLHQQTSTWCIKTKQGQLLTTGTGATSLETFTVLAQQYPQAEIAFEPVTVSWHYGLAFSSLGWQPHLAHAGHLQALGYVKQKTDRNDAELLCDLLRNGMLPEGYLAPGLVQEQRELCRGRFDLVQIRTTCKNRLKALLRKQGLKSPVRSMYGPVGTRWLDNLVKQEKLGIHTTTMLGVLKDQISQLSSLIDDLETKMQQAFSSSDSFQQLASIPGIGLVSAATIIAEVGTIDRFLKPEAFVAYCGLAPRTIASAGKSRSGRLVKGNRYLRFIFIQAAQHQKRSKGKLYQYWHYHSQKRDNKTATVITARKMAKIVYGVLSHQQTYDASKIRIPVSG